LLYGKRNARSKKNLSLEENARIYKILLYGKQSIQMWKILLLEKQDVENFAFEYFC
jgi:hypothetical protein